MVAQQQPAKIYPLGHPECGCDSRFTFGLVLDVAEVLARHGYPDIVSAKSAADHVDLRTLLFQFIYGPVGKQR
ncbi:hypothetical protein [Actinocrispum wychmicini]|uniref:Uncharacterized protein n=1 Tax=Actinocrispum wychmicini TaxID=1213861 RepID=A0A4R2K5C4_9PSEU|nr:hypothetical protein [Actinocrispum wychmicini]TCO64988.1 hypothetical protein EV192_101772 [Actinocrispum wychmicini]